MRRPIFLFACLVVSCGCDAAPKTSSTAGGKPKPTEAAAAPAPQAPQLAPRAGSPEAIAAASALEQASKIEYVRVRARAGVTGRGEYDPAIVTTPISANFSLQEQMIFEMRIPKQLELFEGVFNRRPRSHQEFMTEIIQKSNIKLPPLPPQHRYVYDPEIGELMVEKPKSAN